LIVRLASLASRTTRICLGVACMASFATRDPLYLAAQWASLDRLAGPGRMILVACQGQPYRYEGEDRAFGIPWGRVRVRRMEEGIEALRAIWTQERVTFAGTHISYDNLVTGPKPVTTPHPPIWIAANPRPQGGDTGAVDRMIRRVARLADGWQTAVISATAFGEQWRAIAAALRAGGRDPATFPTCLYYNVVINDDREAAFAEAQAWHEQFYRKPWPRPLLENWVAYGSPREVADKLRTYVEAGVQEFAIRLSAFDRHAQLKRLMDEVLPAFR
jgi:alkanesulfonate monooxygenase SsuD/methylene tetrahydromethanopterin reductase-like flavin-dependent oxidoreductase (luciferase family)